MTAVTYTLLIDNSPADSALMEAIQQIEVEDHASLADMLRLQIAVGPRPDGSGWNWVDDGTFSRLSQMKLLVTVGTGLPETLIEAYVVETSVDFSNEPGESTFTVTAMDATVLLNLEEKIRSWPNMADSDIASMIFGEYGLIPVVESTQPLRQEVDQTVIQRGTDMQFLRHLARRNGYACYVESNPLTTLVEGHFHPPDVDQSAQNTLSVSMGETTNVNRFQVRFNMSAPAQVEATGLAIGSQSDQTASISSVSTSELGRDSLLSSDRPRKILVSQTGLVDSGELQTYSQALADDSAWAITAEGELNTAVYGGLLRAKRPVLVRGLGAYFSGTYYVEKTQHLITMEGYTQSFTLRRNATGLQGSELFGL